MEFGSKLEELELTSDEMSNLGKALKNETFRKMLYDYAEEISNPENKKIYEEEIKQLEKERGMDVQFIHPKPFRVIKTSDGKQKCFINICSNELIGTAECTPVSGDDGRRGLNWSLPYILAPGRPDVDSNGKKQMLYDVVFHPDTLHIASKNARFMELVDNTALDGVQKSFKINLDRKNTKILKNSKYKGAPHATMIRKPAPGHPGPKVTDKNDPLAFPYPYDNAETLSSLNNDEVTPSVHSAQTNPTEISQPCDSEKLEKQPTEPRYTIKYRSVVDLQDYRSSRDSAPSPRPREIVIIIDLPLLKSAADADLDVTEKQVVLKSSKPAYHLQLDLTYPVDENKGQAKYNKQKRQLVVTLPVLPLKEPPLTTESLESHTGEDNDGTETEETPSVKHRAQTLEHVCLESNAEQSGLGVQCVDSAPVSDCSSLPEPRWTEQEQHSSSSDVDEDFPLAGDFTSTESFTENMTEEYEQGTTKERVDALIAATANSLIEDTLEEISESIPAQGETQKTNVSSMVDEEQQGVGSQVDTSAPQKLFDTNTSLISHHVSDTPSQDKVQSTCEDNSEPLHCVSDQSKDCDMTETITCAQAKKAVRFSERVSVAVVDDEDDLPEAQSFSGTKHKQPAVLLREMNPEDGSETIISDHTTSSAFVFQNSLLYELD